MIVGMDMRAIVLDGPVEPEELRVRRIAVPASSPRGSGSSR
jgi:hypothetical protein